MKMKIYVVVIGLSALFGATFAQECAPTQFKCDNGRCIPISYVCDAQDDCGDGSDEPGKTGCPACAPNEFQCENSGRCISGSWACDGDNDCRDWSDESAEACPCAENEFRCGATEPQPGLPGACIPPEWVCDAEEIWDCPDGSDEANCSQRAAKPVSHIRPLVKSNAARKFVKPKGQP